jgi:hypothetical protein
MNQAGGDDGPSPHGSHLRLWTGSSPQPSKRLTRQVSDPFARTDARTGLSPEGAVRGTEPTTFQPSVAYSSFSPRRLIISTRSDTLIGKT